MIEDDEEQMKEELKEAFRIYDKENQGFITNDILKVNNFCIEPVQTVFRFIPAEIDDQMMIRPLYKKYRRKFSGRLTQPSQRRTWRGSSRRWTRMGVAPWTLTSFRR